MTSKESEAANPNTLGLDFKDDVTDKAHDTTQSKEESLDADTAAESPSGKAKERPLKSKPYVNPERVNTGGAQREKLTDEQLQERMARIKEQNDKIKQRRLDVQADEAAFQQTQTAERARLAKNKKVQEGVDKARELNAKRKMDKLQSREWDSGKPTPGSRGGAAGGKGRGSRQATSGPATDMKSVEETPVGTSGAEAAAIVNVEKAAPVSETDAATPASPSTTSPTSPSSPPSRGRGGRGSGRGRGAVSGGRGGRGRGRGSATLPTANDAASSVKEEVEPAPLQATAI